MSESEALRIIKKSDRLFKLSQIFNGIYKATNSKVAHRLYRKFYRRSDALLMSTEVDN